MATIIDKIILKSNNVLITIPAISLFLSLYSATYLVRAIPIPAPANTVNVCTVLFIIEYSS